MLEYNDEVLKEYTKTYHIDVPEKEIVLNYLLDSNVVFTTKEFYNKNIDIVYNTKKEMREGGL